jgi:hypothetical protein
MQFKAYLMSAALPPLGACRFGCATHCAAPVTVFWLFGVISVIYGFFGGPMGHSGISWNTVLLGMAMWTIAGVWTMLTVAGVDTDRCQGVTNTRDRQVTNRDDETDPLEEVKKVR